MMWRDDVVREARSWIGTPYHHAADVKGAGVDCAMILVRVYCGLGLAPLFDPRPYPAQWFLHRDEEKYRGWIERYAVQIDQPERGDICLYRFGRCAAHGAIMVEDGLMVHAYMPEKRVVIAEHSTPLVRGKIDSYWTIRGAQ